METLFMALSFFFFSMVNAKDLPEKPEKRQYATTLTKDFEQASMLNGQGKYKESEQILRQILSRLPAEKEKSENPDDYDEIELGTLYELAYNSFSLNQLEKAKMLCNQAIRKGESSQNVPLTIESYNLSGLIYKRLFMLDKAVDQLKKALDLNTNQNNQRLSKIIMNNIATLYTELEKHKEALEMGRRMMLYVPTENQDTDQAQIEHLISLNTIGVLLSNAKLAQNSVDTFRIANNEIKQNTPAGLKLLLYTNYAKSLNSIGTVDSARYYYKHALTFIPETTNPYNVANLHYLYGCLLKDKLRTPRQASLHFNKAIDLYRKHPTGILVKCLEELADLEATAFNNYAGAYALLSEAYRAYRENTQKQYQDKLSGFEAELGTREKEIQIKELNRQREIEGIEYQARIISTLLILLIVILIAIILAFFLRKKKAEFKLKELSLQRTIDQKGHEIETLTTETTQKMTEQYINGLEDSNQRVAGELHDGICNKLLALNMSLKNTGNEQLVEELSTLHNELRMLSHELASPEFKAITLNQTLDVYVQKLQQANLFELNYFIDAKIEAIAFSQTIAREIYRIIQEALSNIIKHACAQSVYITISENQGNIEIIIEDDGKGYDTQHPTEGIGLRMMKERAVALHATLSIESAVNQGTVVYVSIPCC